MRRRDVRAVSHGSRGQTRGSQTRGSQTRCSQTRGSQTRDARFRSDGEGGSRSAAGAVLVSRELGTEKKKPTPRSFSERARDVFPIAIAHLRRGVLHLQELENRGAVVGDRDVPDVVHEHLVEAHGAERVFTMFATAWTAMTVGKRARERGGERSARVAGLTGLRSGAEASQGTPDGGSRNKLRFRSKRRPARGRSIDLTRRSSRSVAQIDRAFRGQTRGTRCEDASARTVGRADILSALPLARHQVLRRHVHRAG